MESGIEQTEIDLLTARIDAALRRIEFAAAKVSAISQTAGSSGDEGGASSAKVTALVNQHEAMREEVAGTLRELDSIISKLEA